MKNIYFIGIGGIGMSALARFFKHEGYNVAGYDRTKTPLTIKLEQEGIEIHYEDNVALIPEVFKNKKTTKIVYTPAIPATHNELNYFRNNDFELVKRAMILGLLSRDKWTMAVAGTHGKTSTSTMAAWLNTAAASEGSAFLGGVSKNFGTNMVLGTGDRLVVEADEFDRSFLQLTPQAAVITAADPDHLDIYGTKEEFEKTFNMFADQVTDTLIVKKGVTLTTRHKYLTYSLDDSTTDYHAANIELLNGGYYSFDIVTPQQTIEGCRLGIPGLTNVENCIAAVALVEQKGFDTEKLKEAIATFRGVARRFDFHINEPNKIYMDDYAHHPEELKAMISSVRKMFPNRHLTVIFQPHLFTRTRDFMEGFIEVLSLAERVIMIPIYPARELPIEGVSSQMISERLSCEKFMAEKDELVQLLSVLDSDVVVTAGAGDIDQLCSNVAQIIRLK